MTTLNRRAFTAHEDQQAARLKAPPHISEIIPNSGIFTAHETGLNTVSEDSPIKKPLPKSETCPRCEKTVDRLVPALDGTRQRICLDCYSKAREKPAKRCQCPRCPATADWLVPAEDDGQPVCLNCHERAHWAMRESRATAPLQPVLAAPGELVDETPPAPEHYCISCFEPYAAIRPHQRRCHDCAETLAAQWSAKPPTPKPPKLAEAPAWEKLIDHVLDAGKVVNRLDFAVPVDLREVVTAYQAVEPPKAIDFTKHRESKAAWNDDATKQARKCAEQLTALYSGRYDWKTGVVTPRKQEALKAA